MNILRKIRSTKQCYSPNFKKKVCFSNHYLHNMVKNQSTKKCWLMQCTSFFRSPYLPQPTVHCARSFIELQQKLWINLNIKICLARLNIIHSSIINYYIQTWFFQWFIHFFTGFKITILKKVSFWFEKVVPTPGIEPGPCEWESQILATRPRRT